MGKSEKTLRNFSQIDWYIWYRSLGKEGREIKGHLCEENNNNNNKGTKNFLAAEGGEKDTQFQKNIKDLKIYGFKEVNT